MIQALPVASIHVPSLAEVVVKMWFPLGEGGNVNPVLKDSCPTQTTVRKCWPHLCYEQVVYMFI
jgi:hypothetical protein